MKKFEYFTEYEYKLENEPRYLIDKFFENIGNAIVMACNNNPNAKKIVEVKEIYQNNERCTYYLWQDIFIGMVLDRRDQGNHGVYHFYVHWNAFGDIKKKYKGIEQK